MDKIPLQVYILWHKNFTDGTEYAAHLFKKFNRNPDEITFSEIGMPVYFRNLVKCEHEIQYSNAKKTAVVILIDDYMVIDEQWQNYVEKLIDLKDTEENVLLFPVAINSNAFNLNDKLKEINHIRMNDIEMWEKIFKGAEFLKRDADFRKEFLLSELAHELACELYVCDKSKDKEPLKLFLSHTKNDGVEITQTLRKYVEAFSKAKTFFDATDIEIGREFWGKIEKSIENAFFVIIHSDNYGNSIWCRKEVLAAKKHNRPILSVNAIEKEEIRSFPYMANIKTLRISKDSSFIEFYHVITEIYMEAIRYKYNELKINDFINQENIKAAVLTNYPELLTLQNNNIGDEKIILYPDPPLSEEELELLSEEKQYLTPLTYYATNKNVLENKKVAFSISEVSAEQKQLKFYALKDIMCELIKYSLYFGVDVYYGGDLKYDIKNNYNLLKTMIDVLEVYKKINKEDHSVKIYNYIPYPLNLSISTTDRAKYKNLLKLKECVPNGYETNLSSDKLNEFFNLKDFEHMEKWAISLTEMREKLINEIDVIIIMGGKTDGYKGRYPGILEEFLIARAKKKPVFLLGGFGGASEEIANLIKGIDSDLFTEEIQFNNNPHYKEFYQNHVDLKYKELCEQIKNKSYNQLNNGLSKEENDMLFTSENSQEIIELIIKGILKVDGKI